MNALDKVKGLVEVWKGIVDDRREAAADKKFSTELRNSFREELEATEACADALAAILPELEAMARDGERWRMVRNGHSDYHGDCYAMTFDPDGDYPVVGYDLDNRVDRMIARVKAQDFPGYDAAIAKAAP